MSQSDVPQPDPPRAEPPKADRTALLLVFVTVFIDLLGFGIVIPLLPRYGRAFETNEWELGLLMASFSAMQFVFAPVWGRISDRVGRRPILLLGLAGSTVSYVLFGYATSLGREGLLLGLGALTWLFVSRIGAGVAGATIPTAQAYIADVTGAADRAKGMALIGAAFGIGFTFGPLIGAGFVPADVEAPPSAWPGYVAAALSGVAFLFAAVRLPESLRPDSAPAKAHWLDVGSLQHALRRPSVGFVLLTIFLTTFAFAEFEPTLALLTKDQGLSDRHNFYVFAYVGFVLALSQGVLVRRLVPKVGEYRMALAGSVIMIAGLALIGLAARTGSTVLLMSVLPVAVVGFACLTPSLQAILSLRSSESQQGGILGVGQSMSALARILGPVAGIVLYQGVGHVWPYYSGAALMVVGVLMVATVGPSRAPGRDDPASAPAPAGLEE